MIRQALGYKNNQSDRAPERDAEYFEYLFRDANVSAPGQKKRIIIIMIIISCFLCMLF